MAETLGIPLARLGVGAEGVFFVRFGPASRPTLSTASLRSARLKEEVSQ